jgi:hypothetical protein
MYASMFRQFFLRCFRSFSRNAIVSLLPLAMPIIFLLLFVDATSDALSAPAFRVAVAPSQIDGELIDSLERTGLVRAKVLDDEVASAESLDTRKHDALLTTNAFGEPRLLVREGFEAWATVLLDAAARASNPSAVEPRVAVEEIPTKTNDYLAFILPGLFVMVLIQLSMTSTASVVLGDRADGTFRMVASVKGAIAPLISAEVGFRLLFAVLCYTFMMVVIGQATDGWIGERLIPFTAVFLVGALMMIAFGYTLGGVLPGRRNWSAAITLIGLAFWFFSDILFQASQHQLARPLSMLLPPTYLTDALRQIATGKQGTFPLWVDLSVMLMIIIASVTVSLRYFRFDTNDDRL